MAPGSSASGAARTILIGRPGDRPAPIGACDACGEPCRSISAGVTHGSPESQRRSKARQQAKRDHFWEDLAGVKYEKEALTKDQAGRRYVPYSCTWPRCESWHIRPFGVRMRSRMARPA